jgi:hypothetical protein
MLVSLFAAAATQAFAAGTPAFDPRLHKHAVAQPAHVLVLGSPHLSQLPEKLDPALLEPLLDRLAAFKPQVITVEGLSGEQCETLRRFKLQHGSAYNDYCWATAEVEKSTGLDIPSATAEVERTARLVAAEPDPCTAAPARLPVPCER